MPSPSAHAKVQEMLDLVGTSLAPFWVYDLNSIHFSKMASDQICLSANGFLVTEQKRSIMLVFGIQKSNESRPR